MRLTGRCVCVRVCLCVFLYAILFHDHENVWIKCISLTFLLSLSLHGPLSFSLPLFLSLSSLSGRCRGKEVAIKVLHKQVFAHISHTHIHLHSYTHTLTHTHTHPHTAGSEPCSVHDPMKRTTFGWKNLQHN